MGFMASYDINDCPTLVLVSTIAPAFFTRLVSSDFESQVLHSQQSTRTESLSAILSAQAQYPTVVSSPFTRKWSYIISAGNDLVHTRHTLTDTGTPCMGPITDPVFLRCSSRALASIMACSKLISVKLLL